MFVAVGLALFLRGLEVDIFPLEKLVMANMIQHLEGGLDSDNAENTTYINSLHTHKKKIITVTGETGSGVSTVTQKLAESMDYRRFSAGGLFRNIARQRNMTVEQLNDYARRNNAINREIDTLIRQLGEGSETVLDARLGYYGIHDSFRVYLLDPDIAAHRIYADICDGKRYEAGATTVEQTIISLERQGESAQERYFHDYGVDITNTRPFDLVINTDDKTPEEIVLLVKNGYRAWLQGRQ